MNYQTKTNAELLKMFNGKRGTIATEMCRRAGTIKYLTKYCTEDDRKFNSCMRDTIEVLRKHPEEKDKITSVINS